MKQLQETDGTDKHLRAISYHISHCQEATDALFTALVKEGQEKRLNLKTATRLVEDKDEEIAVITAEVNATEIEVERLVLDAGGDLKKIDRKSPQLNAFKSVFSDKGGSNTVIRPEGESQLTTLTSFLTRLKQFSDQPLIKDSYLALESSIQAFKEKLAHKKAEEEKREQLFAQEVMARKAIRQQLNSAHGRLKDFFQADPDRAESYFLADPRAGSSALSTAEERGRVQAKVEYLLQLLDSKALVLTEEKKAEVVATNDTARLDVWFTRALEVSSLEEIFTQPTPQE